MGKYKHGKQHEWLSKEEVRQLMKDAFYLAYLMFMDEWERQKENGEIQTRKTA